MDNVSTTPQVPDVWAATSAWPDAYTVIDRALCHAHANADQRRFGFLLAERSGPGAVFQFCELVRANPRFQPITFEAFDAVVDLLEAEL